VKLKSILIHCLNFSSLITSNIGLSSIKAKISKILVTIDDSESATNAPDYALLITKGLNAEFSVSLNPILFLYSKGYPSLILREYPNS